MRDSSLTSSPSEGHTARILVGRPTLMWLTPSTQVKRSLMLFNTVSGRTGITQVRDLRKPGRKMG